MQVRFVIALNLDIHILHERPTNENDYFTFFLKQYMVVFNAYLSYTTYVVNEKQNVNSFN